MRAQFAIALLAVAGCSSSHGDDDAGGGGMDSGGSVRRDTGGPVPLDGSPSVDTGPRRRDSGVRPITDGGVAEPPPGYQVCGGVICAMGEICCTATGECFDPADPSRCVVPPGKMAPGACASNLDCASDEICEYEDIFMTSEGVPPVCSGAIGRCVMRRSPDECGGFGDGVCGCDGRTYPDPCAASRVGVRVIRYVPCGTPINLPCDCMCTLEAPTCLWGGECDFERNRCTYPYLAIACGLDEQCPEGKSCCAITGLCVETGCAECCRVPPNGTHLPCRNADDCLALDSSGAEGSSRWYCGGEGCGPGGGGCIYRSSGCSGVFAPVCGCDGMTYSNECWAGADGVRIAHEGECM